ncbi:SIR2 family NAD-dependent protein deacylase [Sorangium sp. So ce1128]
MNSLSRDGKRRPKNWNQFLHEGVNKMPSGAPKSLKADVKKIIDLGDPLTACEIIKDVLGRQAFADLCREEFLDPQFQYARIHELIHLLDSRIVITPNFDTIYETYVSTKQGHPALIKSYRDADLAEMIRLPGRLIYKVHGTISAAHEMVFTRSDYASARNAFPASYQILTALVLTHTFLFIGCSLSDPDIALILEDYAFRHGIGRAHYLTIPKTEIGRPERQNVVERTRNLKLLSYKPDGGHVELVDSLDELVKLVGVARAGLLTSQNW